MTRILSIDDALAEAEATFEQRTARPSPYKVPAGQLLDVPCWVAGCGQEFMTKAELNRHITEEHL